MNRKEKSSFIQSFLWNLIFWLLPLVLAMASPLLLLAGIGFYWTFSGGHWLFLFILSGLLFIFLWLICLTVRYLRLPSHPSAKKRAAAQKEIDAFIKEFNYSQLSFSNWKKLLQALRDLNARIARKYGIRSKNPELDLPLSYVFLVLERISADLTVYLENLKFLGFRPLENIKLAHLLWFVPHGKKSSKSSSPKTSRNSNAVSEEESERNPTWFQSFYSNFSKPIFSRLFRLVGNYSVMLYGGQLRYLIEPEDAWKFPIQIAVWESFTSPSAAIHTAWLESLSPNEPLLQVEESQVTRTHLLSIPEWGEIHLRVPASPTISSGFLQKIWKNCMTFLGANENLSDFAVNDLHLLFLTRDDVCAFLDESLRNREFFETWPKYIEFWKKTSENQQMDHLGFTNLLNPDTPKTNLPPLIFALQLQSIQDNSKPEAFLSMLKERICEAFELQESEVHVWFCDWTDSSIRPQAQPCTPALTALRELCEIHSESLKQKKNVPISEKKLRASRNELQNTFFHSRLTSWNWMALLYAACILSSFAIAGIISPLKFFFPSAEISVPEIVSAENPVADSLQLTKTSVDSAPSVIPERFSAEWFQNIFRKHGFTIFACFAGLSLICLWKKFHVEISTLKIQTDEFWMEKDQAIFKKLMDKIDSIPITELQNLTNILKAFQSIAEEADCAYSGKKKPNYSLTLGELLQAQKILIGKLRLKLEEELLCADYLRIRDLVFGWKIYQKYLFAFSIYRKLIWFDPVSATVLELRRAVNQRILNAFSAQVGTSSLIYALELTAFYSIQLYSGNLFFQNSEISFTGNLQKCSSGKLFPEIQSLLNFSLEKGPLNWKFSGKAWKNEELPAAHLKNNFNDSAIQDTDFSIFFSEEWITPEEQAQEKQILKKIAEERTAGIPPICVRILRKTTQNVPHSKSNELPAPAENSNSETASKNSMPAAVPDSEVSRNSASSPLAASAHSLGNFFGSFWKAWSSAGQSASHPLSEPQTWVPSVLLEAEETDALGPIFIWEPNQRDTSSPGTATLPQSSIQTPVQTPVQTLIQTQAPSPSPTQTHTLANPTPAVQTPEAVSTETLRKRLKALLYEQNRNLKFRQRFQMLRRYQAKHKR